MRIFRLFEKEVYYICNAESPVKLCNSFHGDSQNKVEGKHNEHKE